MWYCPSRFVGPSGGGVAANVWNAYALRLGSPHRCCSRRARIPGKDSSTHGHIFISYSRKDRNSAERIAGALESAGWSVWWDRQINAGESFDRRIEHELDGAGCVLVLWSAASVESEWVKNEAAAAMERNVLVPVLVEAVKMPIEFRRRQAVDLSHWQGAMDDAEFEVLRRGIESKLKSPAPPPRPGATPPSQRAPSRLSAALIASAVAIAGLAIAAYWWAPRTDRDESAETPAETYAMICAGSGPFGIRRESGDVRIAFVPAPGKANPAMPPGQCSWSDRKLNDNEPHELCDASKAASQLVSALEKPGIVTVRVAYEAPTRCFRVYRF
jgi:hypothetical protein